MLWHGSKETVPSGWHICDGTTGTPNLLRYFVRCASDVEPPLSSGGEFTHNHTFTGDSHDHNIPQTAGCPGAGPNPCLDGLKTSSDPAVGTTDLKTHLPPWKTLYYIMKLPIP